MHLDRMDLKPDIRDRKNHEQDQRRWFSRQPKGREHPNRT